MGKERLDDKIFESVAKTIENMAFTEVLPTDLELIASGKECSVSLSITEPCIGDFKMMISPELLSFIAEAMLDKPREEIHEEILFDFLSELLNVIAGSFLRETLPDDTKFSLGFPEEGYREGKNVAGREVCWNFIAEEEIFTISVSEELVDYLKT
ncbi:MAG: chemotaxis protein CheX [Desulfobulbaceae bacterium]|nr:chemotaxis protein CheX [Desulfobulbaceae bacterium]